MVDQPGDPSGSVMGTDSSTPYRIARCTSARASRIHTITLRRHFAFRARGSRSGRYPLIHRPRSRDRCCPHRSRRPQGRTRHSRLLELRAGQPAGRDRTRLHAYDAGAAGTCSAAQASGEPAPSDAKSDQRSREIIRMAAAARLWRDSGKKHGYLLFGEAIAQAAKFRKLDPDIADLVDASEEARNEHRNTPVVRCGDGIRCYFGLASFSIRRASHTEQVGYCKNQRAELTRCRIQFGKEQRLVAAGTLSAISAAV